MKKLNDNERKRVIIDYTGQIFGKWTVIGFAFIKNGSVHLKCHCECGTEKSIDIYKLMSGESNSCGCSRGRRDLIKKKFNRWTVLRFSHMEDHCSMFLCKCDCGIKRIVKGASLVNNSSKSCGCLKRDTDKNKMFHDYAGERIGRLVVLKQTEPISTNGNKKFRRWKVRCDCGVEKIIQTQTLRKQKKTGFGSCGCWSKERNREERLKHLRPFEFYLNRLKNSTNNRNKKRKIRKIKLELNYNDIIKLIPKDGLGFCHYCGEPLFWDKYEKSKSILNRRCGHNFDRKDNLKGYKVDNIIFCCGNCNRTRGDRFTYEEFMLISPILKKIRTEKN